MNFSVEETEEKVFKNTWVSYLIISQEAVERQKKKKEREKWQQAPSFQSWINEVIHNREGVT